MTSKLRQPSVAILEEGRLLSLSWAERVSARFHAAWLRDNGQDPATLDSSNGLRLITILDIPADPRIIDANLEDGQLKLVFAPDGARTRLSLAWLQHKHYDRDPQGPATLLPPDAVPWDASLARHLPTATWEAVHDDPAALANWLTAARTYGFALLTGGPTEPGTVERAVALFGFVRETNYGRIFDVRVEVNPNNLAYTSLALQVHTDNPYRDPPPTLQLLHCLANKVEGGESIVVDGFHAALTLQREAPEDFALLAQHSVPFLWRGTGGVHLEARTPILRVTPEGRLAAVRFNDASLAALDLPFTVMPRYYAARRRFAEILERGSLQVTFKLRPGELYIVDNERVLHGRRGYSDSGRRHLQGCYADRDGLLSKLAVLNASGPTPEAAEAAGQPGRLS